MRWGGGAQTWPTRIWVSRTTCAPAAAASIVREHHNAGAAAATGQRAPAAAEIRTLGGLGDSVLKDGVKLAPDGSVASSLPSTMSIAVPP